MIKGGPKIINDGLVLCLDAHDAKSYAGEPTTNVVTYTNLNTGWSKGYQSNITYDEIDPPAGITSQVVGHTRGNNSGYWYSYGDYAPQVPSTVYVVSMYVKTLDSNFRIRFYTADNSETGRVWGSFITVPNDGKWHRIVWDSFTNPSNSQSDSLSFNFSYAGAINETRTKTWFCAPQMEAKSYQTPFVAGSRSATNGWVDRTTNSNDGTLTNMVGTEASHYRDGQVIMPVANSYLDFDGSDDYVDCGSSPITSNSIFSWEAWIYPSTTGTPFFLGTNSTSQAMVSYWDSANNKVRVGVWGSDKLTSSTAISGGWGHTCWTWDGTTLRAYTNGVADGTATGFSFNIASNYMMVGSAPAAQRFGGKIGAVKLYNKVLTAAEVLSNYNATKGRF